MDTKALRQKILDLAIRGKLVPQDPNDEPASVLLERIRAEKQQMVKDGKLKPKDIKNDTVIFKDDDNLHYEKFSGGTVKCIEDEIPFDVPNNWEWVRIKTACVINSTQPKIIKFLPCLWFHSVTFVSSSLRSGFSPVFIDTGFSDLYCIIPSMIKISETNNEITK